MRGRHHRGRHHSGRHGDDGPARHPRGRGIRPCRLSARCRGAADRRTRRAGGRGRSPDRARRGDCAGRTGPARLRISTSEEERLLFWAGRKAAFPAVGRISPDYLCMDGTIPAQAPARGAAAAWRSCRKSIGLRVANVFHAGDGNLHPLILFDANDPRRARRGPRNFGADILRLCVEVGGVLTGEHGVGIEKRDLMPEMFSEIDLDQQQRVKCAFDDQGPAQSRQGVSDAAPLRRTGPHACARRQAALPGHSEVLMTVSRETGLDDSGACASSWREARRRSRSSAAAQSADLAGRCRRRARSTCRPSRASSLYEPEELMLEAGAGTTAQPRSRR